MMETTTASSVRRMALLVPIDRACPSFLQRVGLVTSPVTSCTSRGSRTGRWNCARVDCRRVPASLQAGGIGIVPSSSCSTSSGPTRALCPRHRYVPMPTSFIHHPRNANRARKALRAVKEKPALLRSSRGWSHVLCIARNQYSRRTRRSSHPYEVMAFLFALSPTCCRVHDRLAATARVFALLNMAGQDGLVASMDTKYAYTYWRPETAIRAGDTDGNCEADPDPNYAPLILTPCHGTRARWQAQRFSPAPQLSFPCGHRRGGLALLDLPPGAAGSSAQTLLVRTTFE